MMNNGHARHAGQRERRLAAALGAVLCLVGCTTTQLSVGTSKPGDEASRVGVPYSLMYNSFEIEVTRQVVACAAAAEIFVKADVKALGSRSDPGHQYVLDPNSLASSMKTSEVKLEYFPSGAVKSLNASAEDKTAAVIANTVSMLSKMAIVAAKAAAPSGKKPPPFCTDSVNDALQKIGPLKDKVAASQGLVDSLAADIKALMAKISAAGGQPDAKTKEQLSKRYDALQLAQHTLDERTAALAKLLKAVTDVDRIVWPRDGDTFTGSFPLDDAVVQSWVANPSEAKVESFAVAFSIDPVSSAGYARNRAAKQTVDVTQGVPFRPPVDAVLRVCKGMACPALWADKAVLVSYMDVPVQQLGNVYYLQCRSRPFSSIGCSMELTENGQLQSVGTMHKAAIAEGATAAAKGVVDEVATTKATLDGADLKKLQAQVALRKAEADLAAAEKSLQPNDVADKTNVLKAETELIKAEQAKLEAEEALRKARVTVTGGT